MQFLKIFFSNSKGERLAARMDLPADEKPVAYAIFAHCFTCTKNFKAVVNINRALAGEGIAVLRFDFTGLGGVFIRPRPVQIPGTNKAVCPTTTFSCYLLWPNHRT
jgi:hypothetical protein